jgi:hypothetical protein
MRVPRATPLATMYAKVTVFPEPVGLTSRTRFAPSAKASRTSATAFFWC